MIDPTYMQQIEGYVKNADPVEIQTNFETFAIAVLLAEVKLLTEQNARLRREVIGLNRRILINGT